MANQSLKLQTERKFIYNPKVEVLLLYQQALIAVVVVEDLDVFDFNVPRLIHHVVPLFSQSAALLLLVDFCTRLQLNINKGNRVVDMPLPHINQKVAWSVGILHLLG